MNRLARKVSMIVMTVLVVAVAGTVVPAVAAAHDRDDGDHNGRAHSAPLVLGHRGAAGYRPEHTLAGYELAARMGADFIEPDLVSTKDHVLVARHENDITGTTDVADHPEFAARKTTKVVDGTSHTGWFTEDFTLAEIKTLRAKERLPDIRQHNTLYDGLFEIPTFDEVLALRERLSRDLHRTVGVYPETKHPKYFQKIGLGLEAPLVTALQRAGLTKSSSPVFIQSFEITNLIDLRSHFKVKDKLVFLTSATGAPYDLSSTGDPRTYADLTTPAGLAWLAKTVDGIGPDKLQVIPRQADGTLGTPSFTITDRRNELNHRNHHVQSAFPDRADTRSQRPG